MNFLSKLDVPSIAVPRSPRKTSAKRETAEICRERAAVDLLASVSMLNANQRMRLEHSAASWTARAQMLQRVEDGFARKEAEVAAAAVAGDPRETVPARL